MRRRSDHAIDHRIMNIDWRNDIPPVALIGANVRGKASQPTRRDPPQLPIIVLTSWFCALVRYRLGIDCVRHSLTTGTNMFFHQKELIQPVKVGTPDARFGTFLLEQFGGATGELTAALQY